mmetsp:Transcript_42867/g.76913  ORF Transcript_42867/g.76913 Transcript_42867/m.76913 type:complete len:95 (-) Transcript_42867:332-616(-)
MVPERGEHLAGGILRSGTWEFVLTPAVPCCGTSDVVLDLGIPAFALVREGDELVIELAISVLAICPRKVSRPLFKMSSTAESRVRLTFGEELES